MSFLSWSVSFFVCRDLAQPLLHRQQIIPGQGFVIGRAQQISRMKTGHGWQGSVANLQRFAICRAGS